MSGGRRWPIASGREANPKLEPEVLGRVAARGVVRAYPRNALIHHQGEREHTLAVILDGWVDVSVGDSEGRSVHLDTAGPGECIGVLMLDGGPRAATGIAVTPVRLSVLDRAQVSALMAEEPGFRRYLFLKLIGRVRALTRNLTSLALLDVQGRVVRLLLDLARDVDGARLVAPRPTQREIARRVGASPAMVSLVFRDLVARGLIARRAAEIVLLPGFEQVA